MRPGRASKTAELVAMSRAIANDRTEVARYADPTALALLPDEARARVERIRAGVPARGWREKLRDAYLVLQSQMMVARTVAIDDAVRAAAAQQLVILGAGLDGRAWRMAELRDVDVFEVDHPDTQAEKRARVVALTSCAAAVHFVPVDFARDSLEDALAGAGHDTARRTTWIWEGVVMYLTADEVSATLAALARRSAPGSRVIILYHRPALVLKLIGAIVRRLGEPLRSSFTPEAMRALLARHGFSVVHDDDMATIGARLSPTLGAALKRLRHTRLAVAERE